MVEVIFEVLLLILFRYPGAFVIWMLTGFRKSFKEILKGDGYTIGMVGLVTVVLLIVFLIRFLK